MIRFRPLAVIAIAALAFSVFGCGGATRGRFGRGRVAGRSIGQADGAGRQLSARVLRAAHRRRPGRGELPGAAGRRSLVLEARRRDHRALSAGRPDPDQRRGLRRLGRHRDAAGLARGRHLGRDRRSSAAARGRRHPQPWRHGRALALRLRHQALARPDARRGAGDRDRVGVRRRAARRPGVVRSGARRAARRSRGARLEARRRWRAASARRRCCSRIPSTPT